MQLFFALRSFAIHALLGACLDCLDAISCSIGK
jgi:hypothetical protein